MKDLGTEARERVVEVFGNMGGNAQVVASDVEFLTKLLMVIWLDGVERGANRIREKVEERLTNE